MVKTSEPLRRTAAIIDLVSLESAGLTVAEISQKLMLPVATTFRFVRKLVDVGYLEGEGRHAAYTIGLRLKRLAHNIHLGTSLEAGAEPILQRVADQLGVAAYIAGYFDEAASLLVIRMPSIARSPFVHPGPSFRIHASAGGKVLLAYQDDAVVESIVSKGLERLTERTITDQRAFHEQLATIRKQGFAVSIGENDPSLGGIAFPVMNGATTIDYAVGLITFSQVIDDDDDAFIERASPILRDAANKISRLF
jgi:DNA-binding IclR family transcriptional regulator